METLRQDIRYGVRMLLKNPGMTAIAVLTLALGIGVNTAVFSAMNGLLLRPLPVANADRLYVFAGKESGTDFNQFSYPDLEDLRSGATGFSDVFGYDLSLAGLDDGHRVEPAILSFVTGNCFQVLGLKPAAGRLIYGAETEKPGTDPVVVLGYSYWKKHFNGDPRIVGQQVKLNGHAATVIGVTPQGFRGLFAIVDMQVYLPLGMRTLWSGPQAQGYFTQRDLHNLRVFGVLKPGLDAKQAQVSVNVVAQQLAQQYPDSHRGVSFQIYPERLSRPQPGASQATVVVLALFLALAGLVLLLACTNVASIVLVRATAREREMAVRMALGVARKRLVRQLMTESMLLALAGGITGLALGAWAAGLLGSLRLQMASINVDLDFSLDWRVFAFSSAVALVTGAMVGIAPAWRLSRTNINKVLHEGSRGVLGGTGRARVRSVLAVVQIAGSLVLLVVAGLFVRSTRNAERTYLGFDPSHVLNLTMETRSLGYDLARSQRFYRELQDRVRVLPGVQSVSFAASVPLGYSSRANRVYVQGRSASEKDAAPTVLFNGVTPSYFTTLRVRVLRGRAFTEQDTDRTPLVALVNGAMAEQLWPKQEVIGKRFSVKGPGGPFLEIVGVVEQGKYGSPTEDPQPFFYVPQEQDPTTSGTLQVRTAGAPEMLIADVERQIRDMAPGLMVVDVQSMEESLGGINGFFFFRLGTHLTEVLGLLGLVLALVGVYGVISYAASQRTHEIGVRMALGADRRDILKMVLRQGVLLMGAGVCAGLLLTFVAGRLMSSLLVGVSPSDPLTLGLVSLLLAAVGMAACFIPARRAMKIEPLIALKYE